MPSADPADSPDPMAAHAALLDALRRPGAWPASTAAGDGPASAPTLLQTHISSLLLGPAHVLKLKKPLKLPFLDFSSAERRLACCREELRLNRRTAPALYLGLAAITGPLAQARVHLLADGEALPPGLIDAGVWMRRFDPAQGFDRLADRGALTAAQVDALAAALARFLAPLPPSPPGLGDGPGLQHWVDDNWRELATSPLADALVADDRARVAALGHWSQARGSTLQPLLARRLAAGTVVEGHGDLHLGNVVWHDHDAVPFDALEFNAALRHGDRLNDLAFAFMDLLDHGLPALAWRLLNRTLDATGDHDGLPLLRWLAAYRAGVRAKVALIGAGQAPDAAARETAIGQARRRLALAHKLAFPALPRLVLTAGLSGSGKSTAADLLAGALGAVHLRSDVERKRLHGLAPTERPADDAARDRLYGPEAGRATYDRLLAAADAALAGGLNVVLDAAWLRRAERAAAWALARRHGVAAQLLWCEAPEAVLAARLGRRQVQGGDPSDADAAVMQRQRGWQEPPAADEPVTRLDTDRPLPDLAAALRAWARDTAPPAAPPLDGPAA